MNADRGFDDFNEGQIAILQYGYWFGAMAESDKTKGKTVFLPAPTGLASGAIRR